MGLKFHRKRLNKWLIEFYEYPERTKLQVLHLLFQEEKGHMSKFLKILKSKDMYVFVLMEICMILSEDIELEKNKKHSIEVVIDRIVVKEGSCGTVSRFT